MGKCMWCTELYFQIVDGFCSGKTCEECLESKGLTPCDGVVLAGYDSPWTGELLPCTGWLDEKAEHCWQCEQKRCAECMNGDDPFTDVLEYACCENPKHRICSKCTETGNNPC